MATVGLEIFKFNEFQVARHVVGVDVQLILFTEMSGWFTFDWSRCSNMDKWSRMESQTDEMGLIEQFAFFCWCSSLRAAAAFLSECEFGGQIFSMQRAIAKVTTASRRRRRRPVLWGDAICGTS